MIKMFSKDSNKMARVLALLLSALVVFSGCSKREQKGTEELKGSDSDVSISENQGSSDSEQRGSSSDQEELTDNTSETQEITQIGTKLSWTLPNEFSIQKSDAGWLAISEDEGVAYTCKVFNLVKEDTGYDEGNRVSDTMLKSRLFELSSTKQYQVQDPSVVKIKVADQTGFKMSGEYEVAEQRYQLEAIILQFDNDLVLVTGTKQYYADFDLNSGLNSIAVSQNIYY